MPSDRNSLFVKYSQQGCLFECSLRYAVAKAGCLPWDYPMPTGIRADLLPVCLANYEANNSRVGDLSGIFNTGWLDSRIAAFDDAMNERDVISCDCLPDCEGITYDVQVTRKKIVLQRTF